MKVMAGIDTDITGEAWAAKGVRVGYLEQEPHLDETKNVGENVTAGLGGVKDLLDRFNEISAKFAEPMDDDEMNTILQILLVEMFLVLTQKVRHLPNKICGTTQKKIQN